MNKLTKIEMLFIRACKELEPEKDLRVFIKDSIYQLTWGKQIV